MIKIGIIGCGRILNAHLNAYKRIREAGYDNFRITALVDIVEENALRHVKRGEGPPPLPPVVSEDSDDSYNTPHVYLSDFQDDVDVQVFTDYRDMLEHGDVNAVNDMTAIFMHHEIGKATLSAGKHLLSQKPPGLTVAGGAEVVELAKKAGVTYGIFESLRDERGPRAMGWAVQHGLIGDPRMAVAVGVDAEWSPDKVVADTPWRHDKLKAVGHCSIDWGVHFFDFMRYVVGEVEWVSAETKVFEKTRYRRDQAGNVIAKVDCETDDTFFALMGFENGAIGQIAWSIAAHGEEFYLPGTFLVYGSEGCIKAGEIIRDDGTRDTLLDRFERDMTDEEREQFYPLGIKDDHFALQQLDWLKAIDAGTNPEVDGEEGLKDLACCYAVLESAVAGCRVAVKDVLSGKVARFQEEIDAHYGIS